MNLMPAALREALAPRAVIGMSGVLRVAGKPGGTIYLVGGRVAAVETPGAPGPEVLLLRSHRVAESDWDAAFAATAAVGGWMSAELVARGLVSAGELEALLRIAYADAMFALAGGKVDDCVAEQGQRRHLLSLEPGAEVSWMLAETERRMAVLASLPFPPGLGRVATAPGAVDPDIRLGGGKDEILALADGRRNARDIAFALGRGVYATMLQLAGLREDGLLVGIPYQGMPEDGPQPAAVSQPAPPPALPRRTRDRVVLPKRPAPSAWARTEPLAALRPRSGQGAQTDGTA